MQYARMEDTNSPLRRWRLECGLSLDDLADKIEKRGVKRPSKAKLSRFERGGFVDINIVPHVRAITGLTSEQICPQITDQLVDREPEPEGARADA